MMDLAEAKAILSNCMRFELRDHAFGDAEVSWKLDGVEVATGYFGRSANMAIEVDGRPRATFYNNEARQLRGQGKLVSTDRNDVTGPEEYDEGTIMPGLRMHNVFEELTGRKKTL